MKIADKDKGGTIDQGEFLIAMKNKSSKVSKIIREITKYVKEMIDSKHERELKDAFSILDQDNSG